MEDGFEGTDLRRDRNAWLVRWRRGGLWSTYQIKIVMDYLSNHSIQEREDSRLSLVVLALLMVIGPEEGLFM